MLAHRVIIAVAAVAALTLPALGADGSSTAVPKAAVKFSDLGGPALGTLWGDSSKGPHGSQASSAPIIPTAVLMRPSSSPAS